MTMNRSAPLIHYANRYGRHGLLQQHINKRNIMRSILYHQTTTSLQQLQQRSITTTTTHKHTHQTTLNNIHPQHLYQIINNVDQYYSFLPYCIESKILQTSNCGSMYDAVLMVGLPSSSSLLPGSSSMLEERYVSRVKMTPPSTKDSNDMKPIWVVEAKSIQSQLFDSLKSRWQLSIADDTNQGSSINQQLLHTNNVNSQGDKNYLQSRATTSCNVNFEVEIQVSNPLISFTLNQVLKDVAQKQVDAFEKRCNDIVPMKMV